MKADRWGQRFETFVRALELLREPIHSGVERLNTLEKEGLVQRFQTCLELAWKTLKDYLESEGFPFTAATPRSVLKEAFAAGILEDGQVWMDMLDHRNLLSHTYNEKTFEAALDAVEQSYRPAFEALKQWLSARKAS